MPRRGEEQRKQISPAVRRPVDQGAGEIVERLAPHQRIDLPGGEAAGVERADDGADAGPDHQIGPDAEPVQRIQHADMGKSLGTAAGQHQREGRRRARLGLKRSGGPEDERECGKPGVHGQNLIPPPLAERRRAP